MGKQFSFIGKLIDLKMAHFREMGFLNEIDFSSVVNIYEAKLTEIIGNGHSNLTKGFYSESSKTIVFL